MSGLRKLKRSVAHEKLKNKGYAQVNKQKKVDKKANKKSLFSQVWRDWLKIK